MSNDMPIHSTDYAIHPQKEPPSKEERVSSTFKIDKDKPFGRYIRLSQEDRKGNKESQSKSLENQNEVTAYVCEQQGWKSVLYDEGYFTGTDRDRPKFKKLGDDLVEGIIQGIVVKRQSRLARDSAFIIDFLTMCHRLKKYVYDITLRNLAAEPTMFKIEAIMDDIVSDMARIEQASMMDRKVREKKPFGHPPLGYKKNKKNSWDIIPTQAEKVKQAFDLAKQNVNYKDIAKNLELNPYTVRNMIRNKSYCGVFSFTPTIYFYKDGIREVRKKETVEYQADYIPIIDAETFNQVQEVLKQNSQSSESVGK